VGSRRVSILNTVENLTAINLLDDTLPKDPSSSSSKSLSPNTSPDPVHSTAESNSLAQYTPEESTLQLPATPSAALAAFRKYLTLMETTEIFGYESVYFVGKRAEKIQGNPAIPNCGYDDERDDYREVIGDHLAYRYEVIDHLGKGAFGKVLKCYDHKESLYVAIKVVRNARRFHKQAAVELRILQLLKDRNVPDTVVLLDHFVFREHVCIVFELLGVNLFDYLKLNKFKGFPLQWVRSIAFRLVKVMVAMHTFEIVHCDLKPENVLFTDHNKASIKLIDFGSSCFHSEQIYTYIQSRFYRAPEILLGAPYSMAIDMWSLGCLLAELYTGRPLFPGESESDQLLSIMQALNLPPADLLSQSTKRAQFFRQSGEPKITPNSRGIKRIPGTVTLRKLLPCPDPLFLDFVESR
jgi:predicted Ser/Thr protein kinase